MGRRRAGSVRFDPYYKVQTWDARSSTWVDIQKRFDTESEARVRAAAVGGRTRLMRISETGRGPV